MSHQSGITGIRNPHLFNRNLSIIYYLATNSLREKFADMKDGHIRVVVVVIANGLNFEFIIISKTKEFLFFCTEKLVAKEEYNAERTFNEGIEIKTCCHYYLF